VELENLAQELGNGKDVLRVTDGLEDVSIEPFGEQQYALLVARGTKKPAFTGICEDCLVAAAAAAETRETSMKVSTFQILAHHFADDGAPGAVLLQVAVVVDALELLVIVLDQRIERSSTRVAGFINSCRYGLHPLHNRQGRKMSEKIRLTNCRTATTAPPTFLGGLQEALPGGEKMPPGMAGQRSGS
jgi:hypothetical protein